MKASSLMCAMRSRCASVFFSDALIVLACDGGAATGSTPLPALVVVVAVDGLPSSAAEPCSSRDALCCVEEEGAPSLGFLKRPIFCFVLAARCRAKFGVTPLAQEPLAKEPTLKNAVGR